MILAFIGTTELVVISGIALLLFGGKKLPELMRGLGRGVREFKEGVSDVKKQIDTPIDDSVPTCPDKDEGVNQK